MKIKSLLKLLTGMILCTSCSGKEIAINQNASEFEATLAKGNIQLVDVRTQEEYAEGHIKGAILIDVLKSDFTDKAKKELDTEIPVAVYCRSGRRSLDAASKLNKIGFKKIYNLKGGFIEWSEAGKESE